MQNEILAQADLKKYLRIIGRHKLILFFSVTLISSLALLSIFLIKPRYQTETKIMIKVPQVNSVVSGDVDKVDLAIGPIRSRIMSYTYLQEVTKRLNLVKRLREKFAVGKFANASDEILERLIINGMRERNLVVLARGDYLFVIRAEDNDPELAMRIANTTAQVFIEKSMHDEEAGLNTLFTFVGEQLEKYKNRLLDAEERLADYKAKNIVPREISTKARNINVYESQKIKLEMELKNNSLELELLKKTAQESPERLLDYYKKNSMSFNSPLIASLERTINVTQQEQEQLLTNYTRNHPAVIEAGRKIKALEEKLFNEITAVLNKKINNYQKLINQQKGNLKDINEKIQAYNDNLKTVPAQEIEYVRLMRDKQMNENLYQLFLKKMEQAEITRASDQKKIRNPYKIIDPALLPLVPFKPNKKKLMVLGVALGITVGLGWIFLLEFFNTSVKEIKDLERRFEFPNLGIIPHIELGKGKKEDIGNFCKKDSGYLTEFIRLYKNIEARGKHQVQMITSSVKGEGKSLAISCLAITAARMNEKPVLLIDGDLRNRSLHQIFKLKNEIGFSDLLTGKAEIGDAVVDTKFPRLKVITAGSQTSMAGEVVESESLAEIITKLRDQYSYIFIDAPPVIPVNDAISLSRCVDSLLFIIMAGETPLEIVERGITILEQARVDISGSVVNNLNDSLSTSGYGYGYDYTYG